MNNWHNSSRKVKNHNKGKSGREDFLDHWLAEKEYAYFQQGVRNMYGKEAMKKEKSEKG
jgi:hypothetical protein